MSRNDWSAAVQYSSLSAYRPTRRHTPRTTWPLFQKITYICLFSFDALPHILVDCGILTTYGRNARTNSRRVNSIHTPQAPTRREKSMQTRATEQRMSGTAAARRGAVKFAAARLRCRRAPTCKRRLTVMLY